MHYCLVFLFLLLSGCTGIPEGITPVRHFEINRYLGNWYEIARLDHSFERGLEHVSATYSMRDDGGVNVLNRGFNPLKNDWSEAQGKAYFMDDSNRGYLKVSFFGPFYASYIIFELDDNYQYALVTSSDKSYLWLLSRTPIIDAQLKEDLLAKIASLGFQTQNLIFVKQSTIINK